MDRADYVPMVPFMPAEPKAANAYVPYQLNVNEYGLEEAMQKGTLYKWLNSPYAGNVRGDETLC